MTEPTTHQIARELLELDDKPLAISLDVSTGQHNSEHRVFSGDYFGINDAEAPETVLLFSGSFNYETARSRTPAEIVQQTLDLAAAIYLLRGYQAPKGFRFDQATHPHEVQAWQAACIAQEMLTDTDPEDALAELDE